MSFQHINRKGKTYFLHRGVTKTGKSKYYFSKKSDGELCDAVPAGFEVYENPHAQVFCRRIQPKVILDIEVECVEQCLKSLGKGGRTLVDVKGKDIVIYEGDHREVEAMFAKLIDGFGVSPFTKRPDANSFLQYHEELKFTLVDRDERLFEVSRWCYRGSVDGWLPLGCPSQCLPDLVDAYARHLGEESFFELM